MSDERFELDQLSKIVDAIMAGDRETAAKHADHLLMESVDPTAVVDRIESQLGDDHGD